MTVPSPRAKYLPLQSVESILAAPAASILNILAVPAASILDSAIILDSNAIIGAANRPTRAGEGEQLEALPEALPEATKTRSRCRLIHTMVESHGVQYATTLEHLAINYSGVF